MSSTAQRRTRLLTGLAAALTASIAPTPQAAAEDPAPAPAVLVSMDTARQGSLPDLLAAYGSAGPAQNGEMVLSLQQDGHLTATLVTQGERVAQGAPLMQLELNPGSTGAYSQALSAAALARSQRAHTAQLLTQRLATRDQLAQADKTLSDATTAVETLKRQGADQSHTTVVAPFDGIVSSIAAGQGDRVASGTALLTMTRLDGLVVTVGIEPAMQPRVHPGQTVALQRMTASDDGDVIPSRVLRIGSMVNPKTRLVDVDVAVPRRGVIAGELYRAVMTLGSLQGWIVPHDAVLDDERGSFLFQVREDGSQPPPGRVPGRVPGRIAVRVTVHLLGSVGDQDAVTGAIDARRAVITEGATQLADGDPVRSAP